MTGGLRSHWTQAALSRIAPGGRSTPGRWRPTPGTLSLNYNGDAMLNEWILAWVQHQLPRDPLSCSRRNIFYPGAGRAGLLRAADRAGADGCPIALARRLAGAGPQPAAARRVER